MKDIAEASDYTGPTLTIRIQAVLAVNSLAEVMQKIKIVGRGTYAFNGSKHSCKCPRLRRDLSRKASKENGVWLFDGGLLLSCFSSNDFNANIKG
jgi:hypothetical protein